MKTWALMVIAGLFLYLFWTYNNQNRDKLFEGAAKMCGGIEKLQWVQFGSMWGGFGWGCMPK